MEECKDEITTEEYVSHFDAKLSAGYPKIIKHDGKEYELILKEFTYNDKQFVRIEVVNPTDNSILLIFHLVKTGLCRYHSTVNSMYDISEQLLGTELGNFIMKRALSTLKRIGFSFIVEKAFDKDMNHKDFYKQLGFKFIHGHKGEFIMLTNGKLNDSEKLCFKSIVNK